MFERESSVVVHGVVSVAAVGYGFIVGNETLVAHLPCQP